MGKVISHKQAAEIIGKHFPNVQDKLLNTLQLNEQASSQGDNSLLMASIGQRMNELRPVPFSSAIDLRDNRKYLKWALPPVAVILILLFAAPSILTKPTERLIKHGQIIVEEAPFRVSVKNESLQTAENTDYTVEIELSGKEIPEKVSKKRFRRKYISCLEVNSIFWKKKIPSASNTRSRTFRRIWTFHSSQVGFTQTNMS